MIFMRFHGPQALMDTSVTRAESRMVAYVHDRLLQTGGSTHSGIRSYLVQKLICTFAIHVGLEALHGTLGAADQTVA